VSHTSRRSVGLESEEKLHGAAILSKTNS
jgi:hypothetical protein